MDRGDGVELLLDVGLERRVTGNALVEIRMDDGHWSRRQVVLLRHSPSPREIDRALGSLRRHVDGLLFVVPRAGRALGYAAERDDRVAYAAVDEAVVSFQGALLPAGEDRAGTPARSTRASWTRLAMLRLFALAPAEPLLQSEIARRIGVSHVAVGKQLPFSDGFIEHTPAGWQVVDRRACWERFMANYPGPRGLTTYWAALGDVPAQLDRVEQAARDHADPPPAVSGDFAADFYAPWRRPGHVIAYVLTQPPLEEYGFAGVRAADATIELRTPQDPTVLPMSRQWPAAADGFSRRYTDPLVAAWDLRGSSGGDVERAIDELRTRALGKQLWT